MARRHAAGAQGAQEGARQERHGRAGVGGRWAAWARGTGPGRAAWACCWASRLCTQPVLTQFRLSTVPESIFGKKIFKKKKKNFFLKKMKFLLIKMICLK